MSHTLPADFRARLVRDERGPDVAQAVDDLLDEALRRLPISDDEWVIECLLCGDVDGHAATCPVPALRQWQAEVGA